LERTWIEGKEDEEKAAKYPPNVKVVVETTDWTVIPLENLGDRVCVDTTSLMNRGEGMLVGNSSGGMFLVHAETEENPYVAARPFRVNDQVMVYNHKGEGRIVYVGRSKVERRPMLLIEGKYEKRKLSCILQNAETIRLTKPDGTPISVAELKEGPPSPFRASTLRKGNYSKEVMSYGKIRLTQGVE